MTDKKLAANRRNALKSTGPKTPDGKKKASLNALKHGLRAGCLAIPGLEHQQDWEAHRVQTIQDLAPVGYLETVLAERATALLWRLGRAVRYESEVVSMAVEKAGDARQEGTDMLSSIIAKSLKDLQTDLQGAEKNEQTLHRIFGLEFSANVSADDAVFVLRAVAKALDVDMEDENVKLDIPGFPQNTYWEDFGGWTREMIEAGVQKIRAHAEGEYANPDPWRMAATSLGSAVEQAAKEYEERSVQVERERRGALLAPRDTVEKVTRYETSLERSLFRTLHELQKLQAIRSSVLAKTAS